MEVYAEGIECHRQVWKDGSSWKGYCNTPRFCDGLSFVCSEVEVTYDLKDGRRICAGQGDVIYVPKDSVYHISFQNGGKGTDIYTVNFLLRDKEGTELRFGKEIQVYQNTASSLCRNYASELADAYLFSKNKLKKQALFLEILEMFAAGLNHREENYYMIRKSVALLLEEWNQNHKMNRYAEAAEISESGFYAAFKAWSGKSPTDFRNEIRITSAKSMLQHTNYSVSQIAEMIGFEDQYYFSRIFKKRTGLSPREYRKDG